METTTRSLATRNNRVRRIVGQYVDGLLTDDEFIIRCQDVINDYNWHEPSKLVYGPCAPDCMMRNHAHRPGQIGHLYVKVNGKLIDVAPCRYCGQ